MIRRILVLIDGSEYSNSAVKRAVALAKLHKAQITGIAVVDEAELGRSNPSMGIGTSYYARKMRETRESALDEICNKALLEFSKAASKAGLQMLDVKTKSAAVPAVIEESKYHDLLVMGLSVRSVSGEKLEHDILETLCRNGIIPTVAVTPTFEDVRRVLMLFDGSIQASKTMHALCVGNLWQDAPITLVTIADDGIDDKEAADALLGEAAAYLEAHGRHVQREILHLPKKVAVLDYAKRIDANMLVMGAYGKSRVMSFFLGSLTRELIRHESINLFLHH